VEKVDICDRLFCFVLFWYVGFVLVVFRLSARPLRPKSAIVRMIFVKLLRAARPLEKIESTI